SGDGVSSIYVLAGEEGKVGFIVGPFQNEKGELLDKAPIVAGKRNKYMWYFWGSKEELTGKLSIMAIKEGSSREIDIYRGGSINTAEARIPSSMEFPE